MAGTFKFELVSPERVLVSTEVSEVMVPGADGDFTVLAGHAPVISVLRPGIIAAKSASGAVSRTYVHGGFCEVSPTSLTVLAEKADDIDGIKKDTLEAHLAAAQAVLGDKYADDDTRHAAHHAITHLNSLNGLPT